MRETSPDLMSMCLLVMEFRFDVMLCSKLGNEDFDAGRIWRACSRLPIPALTGCFSIRYREQMPNNDLVYQTPNKQLVRLPPGHRPEN